MPREAIWNTDPDRKAEAEAEEEKHRRSGSGKPNGDGNGTKAPGSDIEPLAVIDPRRWHGKPIPELRWIVPDWIPWGRVFGLYGPGGEGKTTLGQQLLTAVALGKPWLGLRTFRVKVLGVFCEDDEDDLQRRQEDINRLYGCEMADLENMRLLARLGYDNTLMQFDNGRPILTDFWHQLLAEAKDFGAQLNFIDTVADTFGGNEIDRSQVRQYVQMGLGGLARQTDGAVVATAHPSLAGISSRTGSSGSTAWDATFRARAYFHSPQVENGEEVDPRARILRRVKANYAPREETLQLRWSDGVFVNPQATSGILAAIDRRKCRHVFLDQLAKVTAERRPVSASSRASNFAPKIFALRPDREGYTRPELQRAMEELFFSKEITSETYRSNGHEHDRIVPTNGHNVAAGVQPA